MKDDIRVIKQIGTISSGEGGWQKELNIVSVNNGPFMYDLREWSLDHSSFRDGLSFDNEEAKVLFAVLKECFTNGGEDITIASFPGAYKAGRTGQIEMILGDQKSRQSDDSLFSLLEEKGLEFVDKRNKGGALWITGGHELDEVILACAELGYKFFYSEKGGKATKNLPGWFLRSKK